MATLKSLLKVSGYALIGILLSIWVVENPQDSLVARLVTYDKVRGLLLQHFYLVCVSAFLAVATAIPLGIALTRKRLRSWAPRVLALVNVCQTVPSLAVVALSVGFLGVGAQTAIIALWIYSLLPILSNTLVGLQDVDPSITEAAHGMGMNASHVLFRVELPLAASMIMAGVRTAVTVTIGSAILAAFVGGGGMGNLIIAGNNISRYQVLVLGALWPVLMALMADEIFERLETKMRR